MKLFPDCKIHRMPQRSDEWFDIRKGKLTGTGMGSWLAERPECRLSVAALREMLEIATEVKPPAKLKRDELLAECRELKLDLPETLLKGTFDARLTALSKLVGSLTQSGYTDEWSISASSKPPKVGRMWTFWCRIIRVMKRVFEAAMKQEVPTIKDMMILIKSGEIDDIDEDKRPIARTAFAIWQGIQREVEGVERFQDDTGLEVEEVGFCEHHSGFSGVSPDGLIVGQNVGFEGKCPLPETHAKYLLMNELPPEYKNQVHGSMAVTGADAWWFQSYSPGSIKEVFRILVHRDEYTDAMETGLNEFAEYAKREIAELLK